MVRSFFGTPECHLRQTRRIALLEMIICSWINLASVAQMLVTSNLTAVVIREVLEAKKANSG